MKAPAFKAVLIESAGRRLVDANSTVETHLKQAVQLHNEGDLVRATEHYKAVLAYNPNHADAIHLLGVVEAQSQRPDEATALIERAIELRPKFSEALFNLGRIYQGQNRLQEAVNAFIRAARFREGYTAAWHSLGLIYADVGMYDEAKRAFEEGLAFEPDSELLHDAICRTYKRQDRFDECIEAADRGLGTATKSARLWVHRSEACFALGRLVEGWDAYKWRSQHADNVNRPRQYDLPYWAGENLEGKTIVVVTEQGPGETFLFTSMLSEIISKARKCIIVTSARLMPILKRSFPDTDVRDELETAETPDNTDVQSSLIDLGQKLRPSWNSFPVQDPHIVADPVRLAEYRQKYKQHANGNLIVGIAWRTMDVGTADAKSIPLDMWKPILRTPGVTFVSLQYGDVENEINAVCGAGDITILAESDLDPVADLEGHLALAGAMDLVISTSNTAAHAAGSLGIPTWCLLPKQMGEGLRWIWFYGKDRCVWYAHTDLYRQDRTGDWTAPLARVNIDLVNKVAAHDQAFDTTQYFTTLAQAYHSSAQLEAAGLIAGKAIDAGGKSAEAYRLHAKWMRSREKPLRGLEAIDHAGKALTPEQVADLTPERAACLIDLYRFNDAVRDLETVEDRQSGHVEYWTLLCHAYRYAGRSSDAMNAINSALELAPNSNAAQYIKALLMIDCGRTHEAISILDEVVSSNPADAEARAARGNAYLAGGDFQNGWRLYQDRLRKDSANISYARFPHRIWQDDPLEGANVLVWTEQGIGEEILIATLLPDLISTAESVTLLCSARMTPVFARSFPQITVEERREPLSYAAVNPEIDFQMSLSDLGSALRSDKDSFCRGITSAVLKADQNLTEKFRRQYKAAAGERVLAGLSWKSMSPYIGPLKSLPADLAANLMRKTDALFVSVQYAPCTDDLDHLIAASDGRFLYDPKVEALDSMETALAQLAALDCIVTVSNTTAHMAGALGIPTALLAPPETGRHWYWRHGTETSLWYKTVRLIETSPEKKWTEHFDHLADIIGSGWQWS